MSSNVPSLSQFDFDPIIMGKSEDPVVTEFEANDLISFPTNTELEDWNSLLVGRNLPKDNLLGASLIGSAAVLLHANRNAAIIKLGIPSNASEDVQEAIRIAMQLILEKRRFPKNTTTITVARDINSPDDFLQSQNDAALAALASMRFKNIEHMETVCSTIILDPNTGKIDGDR
ncbi:hypothetical protein HOF56_00405 [Candidatus Peribacteria bacterium]|jgi:hypothetical protein|nr:hypothetical protein [Candidatus Peribacteria bacterium]MBT4021595.1 hypothetical protein [Candidatus Peribacteria bacterium]MBT4240510.1 hypothetical protein [Candidatus Peribacteria bacterium]MBT4474309.1 hypothetical protein [Candidatus Peribacteria bacterium]